MTEQKDGFAVELGNLAESGKMFKSGSEQIADITSRHLLYARNVVYNSTDGGTDNPFLQVREGFDESYDVLVEKLEQIRNATSSLGEAVSATAERYKNQG